MKPHSPICLLLVLSILAFSLVGCETMEAIGKGELDGKGSRSNYSFAVPNHY